MMNEGFDKVLERVVHLNNQNQTSNTTILILVGGCSRSGKSTFTEELCRELKARQVSVLHVAMDLWLTPASKRDPNCTVLERYRIDNLLPAITKLLRGKTVKLIPYDVETRELATKAVLICPPPPPFVLFLEGVVALAVSELRVASNLRVFVSASDSTRVKRLLRFYRYTKKLERSDYHELIRAREKEEVPFIKNTFTYSDSVFYANDVEYD